MVFGLRSALRRMSSPGPVRGTMSIRVTPNDFASRAVSQSLFVRHPARRENCDLPSRRMGGKCSRGFFDARLSSLRAASLFSVAHQRFEQPMLALQVIEIEPAVVAHPGGIDRVVLPRRLAINHIFAGADDRVAASRATGAEAFRFLQKPDAHLETEIRRSERADRANIDRIERVIIFQSLARMSGQRGMTAAIDESRARRRSRSLWRSGCSASRGCNARRRA